MELKLSKAQTENTFFNQKLQIRINNLPQKEYITVLDCFHGNGLIWERIQQNTKRKIKILGIDNRKNLKPLYLYGDNIKFLTSMDLSFFDVIDLDAYGVPYKQLKIIFEKEYSGTVFCTFIQSQMGRMPDGMLFELGYTKNMIDKIPTLFSRNGYQKFKNYLSIHNAHDLNGLHTQNKHYISFRLG